MWLFILPSLYYVRLFSILSPSLVFQESARRIGKVSEEAKLQVDVETYVESFKPHIMDVVFAWANGASFSQICKMTDAFEGKGSRENVYVHRYNK